MHLVIVTPFPPRVTGIGQYGYHLSRALARSGAFRRITLLTEQAPHRPPRERWEGLTVERLWRRDGVAVGGQIALRLRRLRPDLVWYNLGASVFGRTPQANLSGLLSPLLGRLAGLVSVVTLHEIAELADLRALDVPGGPLVRLGARLLTRLTTRADVVCVTLRRHADWLAARYPDLPVVHIPHGTFDTPRWLAETEGPELLIFATFAPFKGLELLLTAFRQLRLRHPRLRLTVAGAEHPRFPGYLRRVRRAFGDLPGVRWLGYVPEADLRHLFARATLVVLPYTAATGASSVLYRAATWGRAFVVSDLPELRATVEEAGLQAAFFRCGDRESLVATLDALLAAPELRTAQARHNYRVVAAHLTVEATCRAYLGAFRRALILRHGVGALVSSSSPP